MDVKFVYPDIVESEAATGESNSFSLTDVLFSVCLGVLGLLFYIVSVVKTTKFLIWCATGRGMTAVILALFGVVVTVPVTGIILKILIDCIIEAAYGFGYGANRVKEEFLDVCSHLRGGVIRTVSLVCSGDMARVSVKYTFNDDCSSAEFTLPVEQDLALLSVVVDLKRGAVVVPFEVLSEGKEFIYESA